ncbi:MAG: peptide chain release factor N(5)-glutamine methyltransferase [Balneolaceae bacterium]|nr:MAG: peptide chain release factor N(5)-glutamine methyltransferase [Balneolaceae bacterium]
MNKSEQVWTVLSMLEWATGYFEKRDIPDPRLSIEWILAEILGLKRLDLYLQFDRPLSSEELDSIRPLVKRRGAFEPLQYITGSTQFRNVLIKVTPDVLIPRAETEQLVDLILNHHSGDDKQTIHLLDLGTGSGCIPIAIKKEKPAWNCSGSDISEKALQIAKENAAGNNTSVSFFRADMMHPENSKELSEGTWDIITSNPPYITTEEETELSPQVLKYEPGIALFHPDPLNLYKTIIKFSSKKGSSLYLECNDKTANNVGEIASEFYHDVTLHIDLDGNNRFISARKPLNN